ncbi:hypothetical protein EDC19_2776 [Natranaerovirga hydrolytica]|uniref:Uncharacterized protein n=1 Tax=Natranaerovirga hydrolytica TaxID=680378 RepID=A0A4R1M601_9FIRM|nr:DUF5711 family protein [Natranaerovirga hydrolytica]TCK86722.1 hypothetical protein EDC19_2776 [Natranaerovirga hydrolytica]
MDKNNKKNNRKRKIYLLSFFLITGVIFAITVKGNIDRNGFSTYETIMEFEHNNSQVIYDVYGNNSIVLVSRDGIRLIDTNGEVIWDYAYTMRRPRLKIEENYLAVADYAGQYIYLFDESGIVNKIYTNNKIIDFAVNEEGYISITEERNNRHFITLYTKDGEVIAASQTNFERNGYPLDVAISNDGTRLATSYYYTDGVESESRLTFYNFSNIGQNFIERILGSFRLEATIIPKVEFLNNNVVFFSDKGFLIYEMINNPEQKVKVEIEEEIRSVITLENTIGVILEKDTKVMEVYNLKGEKINSTSIEIDYNNIVASKNQIILHNDWAYKIYSPEGNLLFEETLDWAIQQILPISADEYVLVSINNTQIIKLQ